MMASWQMCISISGSKMSWSCTCFLILNLYGDLYSLRHNLSSGKGLTTLKSQHKDKRFRGVLILNHFYSWTENIHDGFGIEREVPPNLQPWIPSQLYKIHHCCWSLRTNSWGKDASPIQMAYQPSLIMDGKTKLMLCFNNYKVPVAVWGEKAVPGNVWLTTLVWY